MGNRLSCECGWVRITPMWLISTMQLNREPQRTRRRRSIDANLRVHTCKHLCLFVSTCILCVYVSMHECVYLYVAWLSTMDSEMSLSDYLDASYSLPSFYSTPRYNVDSVITRSWLPNFVRLFRDNNSSISASWILILLIVQWAPFWIDVGDITHVTGTEIDLAGQLMNIDHNTVQLENARWKHMSTSVYHKEEENAHFKSFYYTLAWSVA